MKCVTTHYIKIPPKGMNLSLKDAEMDRHSTASLINNAALEVDRRRCTGKPLTSQLPVKTVTLK
jgi:hypothetical protein